MYACSRSSARGTCITIWTSAIATRSWLSFVATGRTSRSSSTRPRSRRTTGPRASPSWTSTSTPAAPSTCSRPFGCTPTRRRSSSRPRTRCTATPRTRFLSASWTRAGRSTRSTRTGTGFERTCRSTSRSTASSARRRSPRTCSCRKYGRYFGLRTACFRGGTLTGPNHSATELHGFLAYIMRCAMTGTTYTVYGYKGKQVRDAIHSHDLIRAFDEFFRAALRRGLQHRRRPVQQRVRRRSDRARAGDQRRGARMDLRRDQSRR